MSAPSLHIYVFARPFSTHFYVYSYIKHDVNAQKTVILRKPTTLNNLCACALLYMFIDTEPSCTCSGIDCGTHEDRNAAPDAGP
jgi:hypothetical protein